MEGISDGRAIDRCYYCDLLYPGLPACPICRNRLRYEPARMANAEDIERDVESAVRLFLSESSREHAHNLLTLVHQIGDHAALQVKALGLAIASLRPLFPPPDANHGDAE